MAIIKAVSSVIRFAPLIIISDSMYAINGLTEYLSSCEDNRCIGIKNAPHFKKAAAILEQCIATTAHKAMKKLMP